MSQNFNIPRKPTYVMPTHFICVEPAADVIAKIDALLLTGGDTLTYRFEEDKCKWYIMYFKNSVSSKFEINLFRSKEDDELIVEVNRLNGDAFSFQGIFKNIRDWVLHGTMYGSSISEFMTFAPPPLPEHMSVKLTDEEARDAIIPLFDLLKSDDMYTKKIGAQVISEIVEEKELISNLEALGGIHILMDNVTCSDQEVVVLCLNALRNAAKVSSVSKNIIMGHALFSRIQEYANIDVNNYQGETVLEAQSTCQKYADGLPLGHRANLRNVQAQSFCENKFIRDYANEIVQV